VAENAPPILAKLRRCVDGRDGRALLARQAAARSQVSLDREAQVDPAERAAAALAYARAHNLTDPDDPSDVAAPDHERDGELHEGQTAAPHLDDSPSDPDAAPTPAAHPHTKEWSW